MFNCNNIIKNIYNHLGDDISRDIFEKRLAYSVTGEWRHIGAIIETIPEYETELRKITGKNNYIFGAGGLGNWLYRIFPSKFTGFIDNDESKWGGGQYMRPRKYYVRILMAKSLSPATNIVPKCCFNYLIQELPNSR